MSETGKRLIESAQPALDYAREIADRKKYHIYSPEKIDDAKTHESPGMSQSDESHRDKKAS